MPKKIIKILLFVFIISIAINAKAITTDEMCDIRDLGGRGLSDTWSFSLKINGYSIFNMEKNYFYTAEIGRAGNTAFCVNPGKARGTTYVKLGALSDVFGDSAAKFIARAYHFFDSSDHSMTAREYAQLMIWVATKYSSKMTYNYTGYSYSVSFVKDFIDKFIDESELSVYYIPNDGCRVITYDKILQNDVSVDYEGSDVQKNRLNGRKCDQTATYALMKAFYQIEKIYGTSNNTSNVSELCEDVASNVKKSYPYFTCETYETINPVGSNTLTLKEFAALYGKNYNPSNIHQIQNDKELQKIMAIYNKLANMSADRYYNFLVSFGNQGSSERTKSRERQLSDQIAEFSRQLLASSDNTTGLEVWCPYGVSYSKDAVRNNTVLKQCFVTKTTNPKDCPTTCNQLLITKEYGKGKKYPTCDSLKNIPGIDKCDESSGNVVITCGDDTPPGPGPNPPTEPPCEPVVPDAEPGDGYCHPKFGGTNTFELTDSGDPDINNVCYSNNVAYKVDGDKVTSLDSNLSTSYCSVYCWESLSAILPQEMGSLGSTIDFKTGLILSGRQFFWGLSYPDNIFATINTRRVCFTKNINYQKYTNDWNANENAIAQAYVDYDAEKKYRDNIGSINTDSSSCVYQAGNQTVQNNVPCDLSNPAYSNCTKTGTIWNTVANAPTDVCTCVSGSAPTMGVQYTKKADNYKSTYNGKTGSAVTISTGCLAPGSPDPGNDYFSSRASNETNSRKTRLDSLISNRNSLRTAIELCQSPRTGELNKFYKYITTMDLDAQQVLGSNQTVDVHLVSSTSGTVEGIKGQQIGTTATGCNPTPGVDAGKVCNENINIVPMFSDYTWNYQGTNNFSYNNTFLFSVIKDGAYFNNNWATSNGVLKLQNIGDEEVRYDPKYGIPVAFTTATGVYKISVSINGLGNNGHFDRIKTSTDFGYGYDFTKYSCPVIINNILYEHDCRYKCDDTKCVLDTNYKNPDYCPPNPSDCTNSSCKIPSNIGLDLVYRLIDMGAGDTKDIFPSIDGDGRNPGENWATFIARNSSKYKDITTYKKVYGTKPLYSIELTPSVITQIRNSNSEYRSANKDPYTSYKDSKNIYKIKCTGSGEQQSCASTYLSQFMGQGNVITGLFATTDESKRIDLIKKYKTCWTKDASCLK